MAKNVYIQPDVPDLVLNTEQVIGLVRRGFTDIIVNKINLSRYKALKSNPQYAQSIRQLLEKYAKLIFSSGGSELYHPSWN